METGRQGDRKRNLPQEMGHPRWELAGRETGRGIYRRRWDIQGGNWQAGRQEEEFTAGDGTSKVGTGRQGDRKRNLAQEMGHPRWELAGRETGRGIYRRRWDIQGGNWQAGRQEEEFTAGDGTSKVGTGRQGDRKRNLPQEMGHPRETNLPHDMGLPRARLEDFDPATEVSHT